MEQLGLLWLIDCLGLIILLRIHTGFAYKDDQPDYSKIMYGGAFKHVTLRPSDEYDKDFLFMQKKLKEVVQNHHPSAALDERSINCYTKFDLWYTLSDVAPIVYTQHVTSHGEEYPVSVPISTGSTYNCELRLSGKQRDYLAFITLTKETLDELFYIYSHIFFPVSKSYYVSNVNFATDPCENTKEWKELYILSAFSKMKSQYICTSYLQSELQDRIKQVSLNYDVPSTSLTSLNNSLPVSKVPLKVMTYNIWNFNPYSDTRTYLQRIAKLVKIIKKADPDVICFQEVRFQAPLGGNKGPSQLDHIASSLSNYQYVYQPAQVQENTLDDRRTEEGLAIFSKLPIIYHDYLLLFRNKRNSADGHQRICLHAVIAAHHVGQIHIFNTHFSLSHEAREKASPQLLKYISLYKGPAVLVGDLNATPEEKAIQMLANDTELIDAWSLLHGSASGFTFNTLEAELSKRIDYIFVRKINDVKVMNIDVLPDNSRSEAASDHRAVQATLSMASCL